MQNSSLTSGDSKQIDLTLLESKATKSGIETSDLPDALTDLYSIAEVNSSNDAFVILLHAFMLDVGFIPKDIPERQKLKLLPENWHEKELYSIVYCHSTCPEFYCSMTCFPLYQQLSVFGTVTDGHTSKELPNICLQVNYYVSSDNIGSSDPSKIFVNVKELSQSFKDGFAYPLLAAIQKALDFGPTFGLTVIMDEVKMQILSCLPVGGLVKMSCVNKEFYELCNSPSLWKKLCLKDFRSSVDNSKDANQDWKKLYKEMYLKEMCLRKRQRQRFPQVFVLPYQPHSYGTAEARFPPICIPPEFGPDFPYGNRDMRGPFSDLQPEARPHNVIRPPPFPHSPLLKIPRIFHF